MLIFRNVKRSLKIKTMFFVILILFVTIGIISVVNIIQFKYKMKNALKNEIYVTGLLVRKTVKNNLEYFKTLDRFAGMDQFLQGVIKSTKTMDYIFITGISKSIIYHSNPDKKYVYIKDKNYTSDAFKKWDGENMKTFAIGSYYENILPIYKTKDNKDIIGFIHLGLKQSIIDSCLLSMILQTLGIFLLGLIITTTFLVFYISKKVVSPVTSLSNEMKSITANMDFKKQIIINGEDEIAQLGISFNLMLNEIKKHSENLEHLVEERTHELNIQKEFAENIINNAPIAISTCTCDGIVTLENPTMKEIMGHDKNGIIGKNVFELESLQQSGLINHYKKACKGDIYKGTNFSFKSINGNEYIFDMVIAPIKEDNKIKSLLTLFIDNTEKYKVQNKLEKAFEEVHSLKVQQDGDYFLTSLLINPLLVNDVKSDHLTTDVYLSQKKKFNFRHRSGDIGGDVCIARNIQLHNKNYVAFVNADAMGKSLQGAGGALVMGVVFNAFVARTMILKSTQNVYPERWLKNLFQELQNIFVSFDGSMLISMVAGLIDEETGMMYYFNAEHPWNVLYRNGKAEFTENELYTRKLGVVGFDKGIVIQNLQLKPGDVLIIGSDGRDDIMLGYDSETNTRIINEDEKMFLQFVEEADGELDKIVQVLKNKGEITDDLSLLKINYLKNSHSFEIPEQFYNYKSLGLKAYQSKNFTDAANHLFNAVSFYNDESVYKILAASYRNINDYNSEAEVLDNALYHFPGNLDFVYRAAICYKKIKEYDRVLDLAERYRFYYPEKEENLINLADTYRLMNENVRSREIISLVEKINPENKYLKKLKKLVNS